MRFFSDIIGAGVARILGLSTLIFAAHWMVDYFLPAIFGIGKNPPVKAVFSGTVIVVCVVIALIFLIPARTRRTLRMRESAFGQVFRGALLLVVAPLLLFLGFISLVLFEIATKDQASILLLVGIPLCLLFYWHFIFPGGYARRLRARELGIDPPEEPALTERELLLATAAVRDIAPRTAEIQRGPVTTEAEPTIPTDPWRDRAMTLVNQRAQQAPTIHREAIPRTAHRTSMREVPPQPKIGGLPDIFNPAMIAMLAAMTCLFSGLYGLREAQFLPNADNYAYFSENRWQIVGVGTLVITLIVWIFPTKFSRRTRQGAVKRAFSGFFAGVISLGLFTVSSFTIGLPGLASLVTDGEPATVRATITEIGAKRVRRGCDHIVYARLSGSLEPGPRKLCNVPQVIWDTALPGQVLILTGTRHPWGFRYDTISR